MKPPPRRRKVLLSKPVLLPRGPLRNLKLPANQSLSQRLSTTSLPHLRMVVTKTGLLLDSPRKTPKLPTLDQVRNHSTPNPILACPQTAVSKSALLLDSPRRRLNLLVLVRVQILKMPSPILPRLKGALTTQTLPCSPQTNLKLPAMHRMRNNIYPVASLPRPMRVLPPHLPRNRPRSPPTRGVKPTTQTPASRPRRPSPLMRRLCLILWPMSRRPRTNSRRRGLSPDWRCAQRWLL